MLSARSVGSEFYSEAYPSPAPVQDEKSSAASADTLSLSAPQGERRMLCPALNIMSFDTDVRFDICALVFAQHAKLLLSP
jgi:hypothetical protein